jgi:hypothetical protein
MSKMDKLKEIIRELIQQELREATVTGAIDGGEGPPKTPKAFGNKKKKKKEISTNSTGYNVVKEEITDAGYLQLGKRAHNLPRAAKQFITALRNKDDREIEKYIDIMADLMKWMQTQLKNPRFNESINEGKYHDYRNDESMTPKQKIGRSMREVRDGLNNLEKLVKMNVRLKNELNVNSGSYWKNTHKALHKISERLVKLANKVGQLQ